VAGWSRVAVVGFGGVGAYEGGEDFDDGGLVAGESWARRSSVDAAEADLQVFGSLPADLFDGLAVAVSDLALFGQLVLFTGGVEREPGEDEGTDRGDCGDQGGDG
jgi:hypothetical protein